MRLEQSTIETIPLMADPALHQQPPLAIYRTVIEPPSGWHLRNNLFKYHAACYLTHAPIECAREIRLKNNFPPERVKRHRSSASGIRRLPDTRR